MSSIITGLLNNTLGVLWDKSRDYAAEQLNNGEFTHEKCRQLIICGLDDIKSKLDSLSRKDLLASVSWVKEGFSQLQITLDSQALFSTQQTQKMDGIKVEDIVLAFGSLEISSREHFKAAKECFKSACKEATRAFNNTALGLEDRILALKLRITARIFENLSNPDIAVLSIKSFTQELNELPAVQETFSVCLEGGFKSRFSKSKRLEVAKSVLIINYVVFNFTRTFSKTRNDCLHWLKITVNQEDQLPILGTDSKLSSWALREFGNKVPLGYGTIAVPWYCFQYIMALINKAEVIVVPPEEPKTLYKMKNECKTQFCTISESELELGFYIKLLTVDQDDNVYAIARRRNKAKAGMYCEEKLFIIDSKGDVKFRQPLEILDSFFCRNSIAVMKNQNIAFFVVDENRFKSPLLHICDTQAKIQSITNVAFDSLPPHSLGDDSLAITDTDDIIIVPALYNFVLIYTNEGDLKQKLPPPAYFSFLNAAFNFVTKSIIVLAKNQGNGMLTLLIYSEGDVANPKPEIQTLGWKSTWNDSILSHPKGPVALRCWDKVYFL